MEVKLKQSGTDLSKVWTTTLIVKRQVTMSLKYSESLGINIVLNQLILMLTDVKLFTEWVILEQKSLK